MKTAFAGKYTFTELTYFIAALCFASTSAITLNIDALATADSVVDLRGWFSHEDYYGGPLTMNVGDTVRILVSDDIPNYDWEDYIWKRPGPDCDWNCEPSTDYPFSISKSGDGDELEYKITAFKAGDSYFLIYYDDHSAGDSVIREASIDVTVN